MTFDNPQLLYFEDAKNTDFNILEGLKICSDLYPANTPKCKVRLSSCDVTRDTAPMQLIDNVTIFKVPGQEDVKHDYCGEWLYGLSCPNYNEEIIKMHEYFGEKIPHDEKHDRFMVQRHCHNFNCPICDKDAARRQANRVTKKLIAVHELYDDISELMGIVTKWILSQGTLDVISGCMDINEFKNYKWGAMTKAAHLLYGDMCEWLGPFKHWTFSIDQEEAIGACMDINDYKKYRKMLYDALRIAGVKGAVIINHPFRQNHVAAELLTYNGKPAQVWYPAPHFHVVGCGFLMQSDKFFEKTGWMYHLIRAIDHTTFKGNDTVESVINYAIAYQAGSHMGIVDGLQSVTYFGAFHSSKVQISEKIKTREPIECSLCAMFLHRHPRTLDDKGRMDWKNAPDDGVHYVIKIEIIYKIRDSGSYRKSKQKKIEIWEEK